MQRLYAPTERSFLMGSILKKIEQKKQTALLELQIDSQKRLVLVEQKTETITDFQLFNGKFAVLKSMSLVDVVTFVYRALATLFN